MTAKQKLRQANLQRWAELFADQKASGLTIRQWCEQNDCSFHKFNYWKHELKEQMTDQLVPDLVRLPINSPSSVPLAVPSGLSCCSDPTVRTNRAIRTDLTIPSSAIRISLRDVTIELPPSVSEDSLRSIIRAVRYA